MLPRRIEDFPGNYRMSGEQRVYRVCPNPACGNSNWKVYLDPNSGRWICFVCKAAGHVETFTDVESLRDRLFNARKGSHEFQAIDLPENKPLSEPVERWVRASYQIDSPKAYLLVSGTGDLDGRVLIPYTDRRGTIVYWNARTRRDEVPKYKAMPGQHPLYVPQYVRPKEMTPGSPLVLVEGAFDAMTLHSRLGLNAVGLGGKYLARGLEAELQYLAAKHTSVRIMLDRDALRSALALRHQLASLLHRHDVQVRTCPGDDPPETDTEALKETLCE